MVTMPRDRSQPPDGRQLLLDIVVLVALLVGAVVATAQVDAWWAVALAVAGLFAAACGIALVVATMLRDEAGAGPGPAARGRGRVLVTGAVAALAVGFAIALPHDDSVARTTTQPTAGDAAQTIRDFLADAVIDDDAYLACQYLSTGAQQRIERLAGDGQTCRAALNATRPSFAGIQSEGALRVLRLHAALRDGVAYVTARPRGRRAVVFVLRRTTSDEATSFEAPSSAWRIAQGELAVLPDAS